MTPHTVEVVISENDPPAQEVQEVDTLQIKTKHAVEAVIENDPPVQEMQAVHTLCTDSTCEPSTKGSILENKMTEEENPIGGVSAELGEEPTREVVPKRQRTSNKDFAGGVPKGAKIALQARDNSPKT